MGVRNTSPVSTRWSHGTVAELFSGRDNSLGLLRLLLATAVVVAHARILGFGIREYGHTFTHGQTDLGKISVFGFFILSGLLITRSGNRLPIGRFLWNRALRLLPGLWVCLCVTALVVAPFLFWRQHHTLENFWHRPDGPFEFLQANWWVRTHQPGISGIMETAQGKWMAFDPGINGALWSLQYEVLCYLGVGLLVLAGARAGGLTQARRAILVIAVLLGGYVLTNSLDNHFMDAFSLQIHAERIVSPIVGGFIVKWAFFLGYAFAIGSLIEVYKDRIPVSTPLAVLSALVTLATLRYGFFFAVGIPAFAYLLVWLAIRLPKPFRAVGRKNDYSYGIYIYGFVVEQALSALGGARWGFPAYLALALGGTLALAVLSWHLVERPALKLKDARFPRRTPRGPRGPQAGGEPQSRPAAEPDLAAAGTAAR
ncbi:MULTISPECIES: acyltransferase [unclassified Streptomyces]|uniref:acyltransferase family protein n=1 Tax=unclassified Streptomyces TaxID=2593676 RepID=UPI000DC7C9A0|nr:MULTISPECIES: acyltransferase [unclassified Streptomyces]AWZ04948.1 acyltransferase [Streptomyces sp. ICC4]AWZ13396.1 acyltransferase [Streptomyces sp. ICC1]